jgi:hypothetical protein
MKSGPVVLAGLCLCLGALFSPARAEAQVAKGARESTARYVEDLVRRARAAKLAESVTWRRLGHYRKNKFLGYTSEADGRPFFLAENGKHDPEAELEATLRGFFGPDPADPELQHPQCRFPARFAWLDRQLSIDRARLPKKACDKYREYLALLRPQGISLVFSSYYLDNPASAFGHTFLRVHRTPKDASGARNELLDYGVDYSASVDTNNMLLYAMKGLLGLFRGDFRKVPFHFKVREYNDFESRDLWEYELALTPAELDFFAAHLWELGSTYFAYYYLSENCSYHVLASIEVVRPELDLLSHVSWPVLPAETVKALYRNPGLVRSVSYRASNRTQFKRRLIGLSSEEVDLVMHLMEDPHLELPASYSAAQTVKVLDVALDLIDVRVARDLVKDRTASDNRDIETQQELLVRRASILVDSVPPRFAPPFRSAPHLGHGATRLGLGSGYDREEGWFHELSFRLALHDLTDPAIGYPEFAEIQFLPFTLRYDVEEPRVTLQSFSAIRVQSLTPVDRFATPLAFGLDVGFQRTFDEGCYDCPTGFASVEGGFAVAPFDPLLLYALGEVSVNVPIRDSGLLDVVRVGVGPHGGFRLRFSDNLALLAEGHWAYLPGQDPFHTWSGAGKLRWQYTRNFALGAEGEMFPSTISGRGVSYLYF